MSFSTSTVITNEDTERDVYDRLLVAISPKDDPDVDTERKLAVFVASKVAQGLFVAVDDRDQETDKCRVQLTISGHMNPGHHKRQGWANDFIQVSVTQLDPEP